MKIVRLPTSRSDDLTKALAVVERLRDDLLSGRITAFYGVSLDDADNLESWTASTKSVSYVRAQGAVSHLLHCLHSGDA